MVDLPVCSLCTMPNRDVLNVLGRKQAIFQEMLTEHFPVYKDKIKLVCRNCWHKLDSFQKFKRSVENNFRKRILTPGKESTPKRRKPVIEGLLSSLEKLKLAQNDTNKCEATKLSAATDVRHAKKQLFAPPDHTYSEMSQMKHSHLKTDSHNQKEKKEIIQETMVAVSALSSGRASVLSSHSVKVLTEETLFAQALQEMTVNVPFLFELLDSLIGNTGNKKATIAFIYAMILNSRNRQVSAMQKLLTVLAIKCHADNKLLSRLNKLHITMSAESKVNIVSVFCDHHEDKIINDIRNGKDGKLNGDNLDLYVTTNDIRMSSKNRDYHFFASDWTPFRIADEDFSVNEYLQTVTCSEQPEQILNINTFHPDLCMFKENMKFLIAREFIQHCGQNFKWMGLVVPDHIKHPLEEIMSRKTTSYTLPILLKNEVKYDDCISILDSYEDTMASWYRKAGRGDDFGQLFLPIGGDQLTRVRFDGAKSLRMGAHTIQERFDNLFPVVVEMFHMQMDFLEKLVKKFMKKSTGRDVGTLSNLQIAIQRTSVNGNVKSRFKAHQEFVMLIGRAYVLEAAMEHFGMETLSSPPTQNIPPDGVEKCHQTRRLETFNQVMDKFLNNIIGPLTADETPNPSLIEVEISGERLHIHSQNGEVSLQLQYGRNNVIVKIPVKTLQTNKTVKIALPGGNSVDVCLVKGDDLNSYVKNFLQYYFIVMNLKDTVAEGDIFRLNNLLKMMIPFFYDHSPLSKYMVECIDFIIKTEVLLPPKLAMQVRVSSFVNPKGKKGKNKAADMQKENQVKEMKDLIRGLGSNKTEKSIVNVSKAYPVIKDIVSSLDNQIGYRDVKSGHKSRSEEEDLKEVLRILRQLRPFQLRNGRLLTGYNGIHNSVFCKIRQNIVSFKEKVMNIANRARHALPVLVECDDNEYMDEENNRE